jgi:DNA-binding NarL/FixJ family response regulator
MGCSVLLVDDHSPFRNAARALLEAEGFVVLGEAVDGRSALSAAALLRPDLVVLDVQLPDLDGFAVAEQLRQAAPPVPAVVLISTRSASSYRTRLASSTALGFVRKQDLSGAALTALLMPPAVTR